MQMDTTAILGWVAGVCTATALLPQVIKTIKEKKAQTTSVVMLVVLFLGNSLWIAYGIMKKDWPIIITNSFSMLVNITMLILRIIYRS
jgi:MtN3 and saliva related transmembrane protein